MTRHYSEDDAVATVTRLTRTRLTAYVRAGIIAPVTTDRGPAFRQIDLLRLELLCDLTETFDLDDDALDLVLSLVDQLHGLRGELHAVLDAVAAEDDAVRTRIAAAIRAARIGD